MHDTALIDATETEAPGTEASLVAHIQDAFAAGEPISICGNASKSGLLRPVQAARTLSARNLSGISLYSPNELIISAGAGTKVAEIEAALAAQGQHLIAEPPDFTQLYGSDRAPTVGGMVAANLSGSRRVAWGATRDHVMGVRAVNGTGEVIRAGGRVLKNVTGLDLCKLLTGSHGTLAVMTEITLKVLPAPERRATLAFVDIDPARGVEALAAALGSPYAVSGAAYLPAEAATRLPMLAWLGGSVTLARIEDFGPSVAYRTDRLRSEMAGFGLAEVLDDGATRALWSAIGNAVPLGADPAQAVWRVSVRPSSGPAVAVALQAAIGAQWFMDWGGGLVWIAGPATSAAHDEVVRVTQAAGGVWILVRGPDTLRTAVDVIPPEPSALSRIGQRVKAAFDPKGILNPGRMRAGF